MERSILNGRPESNEILCIYLKQGLVAGSLGDANPSRAY